MSMELNKESVEQAGANVGHGHVFPRADGVKMRCGGPGLCSECTADASRARAALAQPSPAPAEAERPEVVGDRSKESGMVYEQDYGLKNPEALTTVAECERIVGALRAELETERMRLAGCGVAALGYFDGCADAYKSASLSDVLRLRADCDAVLARVAELEAKLSDPTAVHQWQFSNAWFDCSEEALLKAGKEGSPFRTLYAGPVAQAQQLHDLDKQCRDDVARALGLRPNQERGFAWSYLLASIKSCVKASGDSAQAQHSVPDVSGCRRNRSALTDAQMRRLYDNSTEAEKEHLGFAAFARLMRLAEAVHQIAAAPGKEGV